MSPAHSWGWNKMVFKVPFNPNHSENLWTDCSDKSSPLHFLWVELDLLSALISFLCLDASMSVGTEQVPGAALWNYSQSWFLGDISMIVNRWAAAKMKLSSEPPQKGSG